MSFIPFWQFFEFVSCFDGYFRPKNVSCTKILFLILNIYILKQHLTIKCIPCYTGVTGKEAVKSGIFGPNRNLGPIFWTCLHMHKYFISIFVRSLHKLTNKNIKTLCICWRGYIFSAKIWISGKILAISMPKFGFRLHMHKHLIILFS